MPEYLAPAVFVEETSFRSKSIEGVGTSTAAFVGLTSRGPVTGKGGNAPPLLTSFADFEHIYGGFDDLQFASGPRTNYLAHAVRAFFDNGGGRVYVARILARDARAASSEPLAAVTDATSQVAFVARSAGGAKFTGNSGANFRVSVRLVDQQSTLGLAKLQPFGTLVRFKGGAPGKYAYRFLDNDNTIAGSETTALPSADEEPVGIVTLSVVVEDPSESVVEYAGLGLHPKHPRAADLVLGERPPKASDALTNPVKLVTGDETGRSATPNVLWKSLFEQHVAFWNGAPALAVAAKTAAVAAANTAAATKETEAATAETAAALPAATDAQKSAAKAAREAAVAARAAAVQIAAKEPDIAAAAKTDADAKETAAATAETAAALPAATPAQKSAAKAAREAAVAARAVAAQIAANEPGAAPSVFRRIDLKNGSDGSGAAPSISDYKDALGKLGSLEDVSIIAAPGGSSFKADAASINGALVIAAEKVRAYRIAVLDPPPELEIAEVRELKSKVDSKYAALYYPWVVVPNPLAATDPTAPGEIALPPSGFVCGIYARSDIQRGVWKAPANETISGALRLERDVSFGEQEVLNPLGVNCLRFLPNRGYRVWGARTTSSDPEWKYVNIRRYFLYLESSIDRGSQWAVFEPNGERLWANVRETISDFLYNEWINGALLGNTPKEAFFVRCDRSTMTQNDLDNGRLICLIGVAAIKPAEFVIFRIGQKTADARN